jgi:hypothetical protein
MVRSVRYAREKNGNLMVAVEDRLLQRRRVGTKVARSARNLSRSKAQGCHAVLSGFPRRNSDVQIDLV